MNVTLNEIVTNAAGKAQKSKGLSTRSFLVTLAVYGCVFIAAAYIFTLVKDKKAVTFDSQPRCDEDSDLEKLPEGQILWISHLENVAGNDLKLIDKYGLDCYFLLRLLKIGLKLLVPLSVVTLPILLPVYYTAGSNTTATGLDKFGISNIQPGQDIQCWIITLVGVLLNVYVCHLLVSEFKTTADIRQMFLQNRLQSDKSISVIITEIPSNMWNVEILERAYAIYNGGPAQVTLLRKEVCDAKEIELRSILNRLKSDQAKTSREIKFIHKIPQKITECHTKWQIRSFHRQLGSIKRAAILRFDNLFTVHLVLQSRMSTNAFEMKAHMIDESECWQEVFKFQVHPSRDLQNAAISLLLYGMSVLWAIPIAMTGLLSQLVSLRSISSELGSLSDSQLATIQGLVPQVALSLLMCCFPLIICRLIGWETIFQRSHKEVLIQRHYFVFLYIQAFLVVSISSSVTAMIPDIIENVQTIPTILADNLPKACNYFYSYFLSQVVTQSIMVLFQLPESLWTCFRRVSKRSSLRTIQWSLLYPILTNLLCICIIFAPVSPLILLIGLVAFGVFQVTYSYQAIYVSKTEVETGGLLYWAALNHILVGVYTMDIFIFGLLVLRGALVQSVAAVLVLSGVALTHKYVLSTIRPLMQYVSGCKANSLLV